MANSGNIQIIYKTDQREPEAGIVSWRVRLPLWCQHPMWVALFLLQLPDNAPGKTAQDDQSIWAPATRVANLNEAPGFDLAQLWLFGDILLVN